MIYSVLYQLGGAEDNKKTPAPEFRDKRKITPAVPPGLTILSPTHLTHYHAFFADNGWSPRRSLLMLCIFAPPSKVHSIWACLPQSHHLRLSWKTVFKPTTLSHRFVLLSAIIAPCFAFVKRNFKKISNNFLPRNSYFYPNSCALSQISEWKLMQKVKLFMQRSNDIMII